MYLPRTFAIDSLRQEFAVVSLTRAMDDGGSNSTVDPPTPAPTANSESPGTFSAASFKSTDDAPVDDEQEVRAPNSLCHGFKCH